MRVKLFTLRYSASLGGFDETPLAEFIRDKEILAFREHFFTVNQVPHFACVLTWEDAVVREEDLATARDLRKRTPPDRSREPIRCADAALRTRRHKAPDPTEGLDERERALFNSLREWRSAKAHEEGVPPYLIFTNKHFVEMVTRRPDSPTALTHLHGIGPGKVKRYAQEVLQILGTVPTQEGQSDPSEARKESP